MEIDIELYNRIEKTARDLALVESCKEAAKERKNYKAFPIGIDMEGISDEVPRLTRWGFLSLGLDATYMQGFYIPICNGLLNDERQMELDEQALRALRASLVEFAILGCMEAQKLLTKLSNLYGADDDFIGELVLKRCPNLNRFLHAQAGSVHGNNEEDSGPEYQQALKEVQTGYKKTHWIWYIFPQLYGIKGTHSRPCLYYGIRGRKEAFEYINHPILRARLTEICQAVLDSQYDVYEIFGTDVMKVRSCAKLFSSVSDIEVLKKLCRKYRWE